MDTISSLPTNNDASVTRRALALILDLLFLIVPCAVIGSMLPLFGGAIVWFFYSPVLEASSIQATLGKKLLGLQVVDLQGQRLTLQASTVRNVMKLISGAICCLGFILALFTKRKQTFHDIVAETLVVNGTSSDSIADSWVAAVKGTFKSAQEAAKPLMPQSKLDQLDRLQKMREQGTLTEEEFQTQKSRVLDDRF